MKVPPGLPGEGLFAEVGLKGYTVYDSEQKRFVVEQRGSFNERLVGGWDATILPATERRFLDYILARAKLAEGWGSDGDEGVWFAESVDLADWVNFRKVSDSFPWSLTAALTPGAHHVRLYLETEGKIKTMVSEKDNFVKFHSEGSPRFLDLSTSRPLDIRPRDPNVTQNDLGVYALTWDNRNPRTGPGDERDASAVSPTFGLAFSVDGLNWTVYSNKITIENLPEDAVGVRHVVPVFLKDDQLRLYFTLGEECAVHCTQPVTCSLGTAISN